MKKIIFTFLCIIGFLSAFSQYNKMYILDNNNDRIIKTDLDGNNIQEIITNVTGCYGSAIDEKNGTFYFAGYFDLRRANLDGSNEIIISDNVEGAFEDIAIDTINNKIYWTEFDTVKRADLDGSNVEDLYALQNVMAIALDYENNKMYFSAMWLTKDIIMTNLDGSDPQMIYTCSPSNSIMALDFDRVNGKLYWNEFSGVDFKCYYTNFDGSNVTDLGLDFQLGGFFFDYANNKLYSTDMTNHRVIVTDFDGSNQVELITTGLESPSDIFLVNENPTNISDLNYSNIQIYPNPAKDFLTIKGAKENSEIIIYNEIGKELINCELQNGKVNINKLPNGFYTIKIKSNSLETINKFIKQ